MKRFGARRLLMPSLLVTALFCNFATGAKADFQIVIGDVTIGANDDQNLSKGQAGLISFNSNAAGKQGFKVANGWSVEGEVKLDGPGGALVNATSSITLTSFTLNNNNTAGALKITFENTFAGLAANVFAADSISGTLVNPLTGDKVTWQSMVGNTPVAPPAGAYEFVSTRGNPNVISGKHNTGGNMIASGNKTLMGILNFDLKSDPDFNKPSLVNFPNSAEVGAGDSPLHVTPEPSTFALAAFGVIGAYFVVRRRSNGT
jgi:hypothetical protein